MWKVIRSGSWIASQDFAHADSRGDGHPSNRYDAVGFRVVSTPQEPIDTRIIHGGSCFGIESFNDPLHLYPNDRFNGVSFRVITTPPQKPIDEASRVMRGSSCFNGRDQARANHRVNFHPMGYDDFFGFRVVSSN